MDELTRVTAPTLDVLAQLLGSTDPTWGLLIVKATGRPAGTVYPILDRLERLGWIESEWEVGDRPGARRRLYSLTGEAELATTRLMAERRPASQAAAREALA
ncbi:MAG: helix-turn-helix transcriptional regulator [Rhodoglobus sp.]